MPNYKAKYTPQERKAFGSLLRELMADKGLNGAELARQANRFLPSGTEMNRSTISWYLNGRSIPTPAYANALGKVLNIDPQAMLPRDHAQKPGEAAGPPAARNHESDVRMSLLPGGQMHLMVNIRVPAPTGWKILEILQGESDQGGPVPPKR